MSQTYSVWSWDMDVTAAGPSEYDLVTMHFTVTDSGDPSSSSASLSRAMNFSWYFGNGFIVVMFNYSSCSFGVVRPYEKKYAYILRLQ